MSKMIVTFFVTDILELEDIDDEVLVENTVDNSHKHLKELLKSDYKIAEAEVELIETEPVYLN
jgi:hypothetical protein